MRQEGSTDHTLEQPKVPGWGQVQPSFRGQKYLTQPTVRGLEARTIAKLEKEGWEYVSQEQGTVRSELTFRRPKPATPWKLIGAGGGLLALLVVGSLIIGAVGGGDSSNNSAEAPRSPAPSQIAETEARTAPAEATAQSIESPPAAPGGHSYHRR